MYLSSVPPNSNIMSVMAVKCSFKSVATSEGFSLRPTLVNPFMSEKSTVTSFSDTSIMPSPVPPPPARICSTTSGEW